MLLDFSRIFQINFFMLIVIYIYVIEPVLQSPCPVVRRICKDLFISQIRSFGTSQDQQPPHIAFPRVYFFVNP